MNCLPRMLFTAATLFLSGTAVAQPVTIADPPVTLPPGISTVADGITTPALTFEQASINFGKVDEGVVVPIEFKAINNSDRPVRILDVKTGCGCTAAKNNPSVIAPGESGTFSLTYDTNGRGGSANRTITIQTDDPARPMYQASFSGEVRTAVSFLPRFLNFETVDEGKSVSRQLVFRSIVPGLKVTGWETPGDGIVVREVESRPYEDGDIKGTEVLYEVVVTETHPTGRIMGAIRAITEPALKANTTVQVQGQVVGDIVPDQSRVFATVRTEESTTRTVTLSSRTQTPFTVARVVVTPTEVPATVSVESTDRPDRLKLHISMRGEGQPRTYQGMAEIFLSAEGKPESRIMLPIVVAHRPAQAQQQARIRQPAGPPMAPPQARQ